MDDADVAALASEDSEATEYLMVKYKNFVLRKVRAYFIVGADKDDLVQEGMIGLYKGIRDYKPESNVPFAVFADVCITRHIITTIKAATRLKHAPLNTSMSLNKPAFDDSNDGSVEEIFRDSSGPSPEELYIDKEDLETMESRISGVLTDYEAKVLELYLDGMTYQVMAEKLGRSVKSVDNALQRAKSKIEKISSKDVTPGI